MIITIKKNADQREVDTLIQAADEPVLLPGHAH